MKILREHRGKIFDAYIFGKIFFAEKNFHSKNKFLIVPSTCMPQMVSIIQSIKGSVAKNLQKSLISVEAKEKNDF